LPVGIAERALSATECLAFRDLPPAERTSRFFALWVAKEAAVKAAGLGLRQPFDGFEAADIVRLPREGGDLKFWVAALPAPRPGHVAAIASAAPIGGIRMFHLPDSPGG
jgi:phosphopantetheinyl transferase